jgi:hypothetical protein
MVILDMTPREVESGHEAQITMIEYSNPYSARYAWAVHSPGIEAWAL